MTSIEKQFWLQTVPGEITLVGGATWFFVVFDKIIPLGIFCGIMAIKYLVKEYTGINRELGAVEFYVRLIDYLKKDYSIPESKIDQAAENVIRRVSDDL